MQDILNTSALVSTAPSISSAAMTVDFNASVWTARKKDHRASAEITHANYADRGVANVTKNLLGDCEELKAVQKFAANTRNIHYSMTMPWSDNGARLLTTAQYFKYNEVMTDLQNEFHRLVDEFLTAYDKTIENAAELQVKLGAMWNADEYPTRAALEDKFGFRINYVPLPDSGDFRLDIGNEAMAQIKTQYEEHYTTAVNAAMKDIWQKLHDNLTTLARQLGVNEEGKGNKLYDTVFDRALELTDMLGTCNVTGDSQMEAMRQRLEQAFHGLTIGRIKNSPTLREDKQKELAKAIAAIPSLDM
tara:strand:+ start:17061 stop:17972 length:912 start_codon:yes stop_codon:yes gene_type:complete